MFAPTNDGFFVNYLGDNAANFDGLSRLEHLVRQIGPPKWPWAIDTNLAPARYPFLWNAPVQDKTQRPGFAKNANDILGLARNLGEVFGVFGWEGTMKLHRRRFLHMAGRHYGAAVTTQ